MTSVGIGTHYPLDAPTAFKLEIESIAAKSEGAAKKPCRRAFLPNAAVLALLLWGLVKY